MQGAQGRPACGWHERVKRKVVLGESVRRKLLPMRLGRAGSPRSRETVGSNAQPMGGSACEGISNQLRSAGAALQRLLQIPSELLTDALGAQQPLGLHQPAGLLRLCGGRSRRHLGCAGGLLLGCHSPTRAARYVGRRGATTPWLCVPVRI